MKILDAMAYKPAKKFQRERSNMNLMASKSTMTKSLGVSPLNLPY